MLRLIIALIVVVGIWAAMAHLRRLPEKQRKQLLWRMLAWGGGFALILMVATGRAHWLFAVLGGLLPLAKMLFTVGIQLFPLWKQRQQQTTNTAPSGPMDVREAMDTLGLKGAEGELTREDVIGAHRKLMQKLHPDRGGNDYLAAKVNEAKALLLKRIG